MVPLPEAPKSIPAMPGIVRRSVEVLAHVDALPRDATGALRFGHNGMVLIESRAICWAVAPGMQNRLTELLRQQRNPPIDAHVLEELFRKCLHDGRPIGEALLASGQVTEDGLRSALFRQTSEAIAHIAQAGTACDEFVPHVRSRYDARFVFSTAEVLASLGARRHRALAAAARTHLTELLVPDVFGAAFIRESEGEFVMVSAQGCGALTVNELTTLGRWVAQVFELGSGLDDDMRVAVVSWTGTVSAVIWRAGETNHVALCASRAASALVVSRLTDAGREDIA